MDTNQLSSQIAVAAGPVENQFLSPGQLSKADAVIDAQLMSEKSINAEKLTGSMIKAFLRLPFENGPLDDALAHFINADFAVLNEKTEQNGRAPTADIECRVGSLDTDAWSLSQVIRDDLSRPDSPYNSVAEQTGRQMAMLSYGCEKQVNHTSQPFDVLEQEFTKNGISPFKNIRLFELGGDNHSMLANSKKGISKLLGSYRLHTGGGGRVASSDAQNFVGAQAPAIPPRDAGQTSVIIRNVFNFGAVEKSVDPYENVQNLLCAFANTLPDGGKLYVSTSLNDAVAVHDVPELLAHTGFKNVGSITFSNDGKTPSYVLERDFKIKGPEKITPANLDDFASLTFRRGQRPGQRSNREMQ